jgi:hypothetical protein
LNPEYGQATGLPGGKKNPPHRSRTSPCRARQGLQRERKRRRRKKKRKESKGDEETIGDILAAEAPLQEIRQIARDKFPDDDVASSLIPHLPPELSVRGRISPTEKDNTSEDAGMKQNGCRALRCKSRKTRERERQEKAGESGTRSFLVKSAS